MLVAVFARWRDIKPVRGGGGSLQGRASQQTTRNDVNAQPACHVYLGAREYRRLRVSPPH